MSEINTSLTQFINYSLHNDLLTGFFLVFNFFGGPVFVILLTITLAVHSRKLLFPGWIFGSYLTSRGIVEVLKRLIYEPRPYEVSPFQFYRLDETATGSSFPSGHAMTAFLLVILLSRYFKLKDFKHWVFCVLAIPVAIGRVYLGVHWFGDIVVGAVLGIVFGLISWRVYRLLF